MDLGLKDRVAIVAAGSRGIGYAAARELAREGARVFLCSRDEKRAAEAAQKIHEETGANVAGIAADVTNEKESEQFVRVALERADGPFRERHAQPGRGVVLELQPDLDVILVHRTVVRELPNRAHAIRL